MGQGFSLEELAKTTGESLQRLEEWRALGLLGAVEPDGRCPADALCERGSCTCASTTESASRRWRRGCALETTDSACVRPPLTVA